MKKDTGLRDYGAEAGEFFRLMKPLVPPGGLSLVITNKPNRDAEKEALRQIIREAQAVRARRVPSLATLYVDFSHSPVKQLGSQFYQSIDTIGIEGRLRRLTTIGVLLILLCVLARV